MEVSQKAAQIMSNDEAALQLQKHYRLTRLADCCASCGHGLGYPHIYCSRHEIGTKSVLICNDYERRNI